MSTEGKTLVDYEGKFLMIELDEHAGELKEYNVEKATPAAVIVEASSARPAASEAIRIRTSPGRRR